MCKVRGCDKCYTHPSSLRKHMKLHCNKAHVAKSGHARPEDEDRSAEGRSARDRVQVSTLHPTQDVRLSPESPDDLTPRSRFHHTFDSSLDYSPHRSQPLLDPLLLQRGSYRSQSSQYPCSQAGQAFAQSSRTFTSASPFQKSIVNGWYTCHTGVDSFSPKQCNNIPSLWDLEHISGPLFSRCSLKPCLYYSVLLVNGVSNICDMSSVTLLRVTPQNMSSCCSRCGEACSAAFMGATTRSMSPVVHRVAYLFKLFRKEVHVHLKLL